MLSGRMTTHRCPSFKFLAAWMAAHTAVPLDPPDYEKKSNIQTKKCNILDHIKLIFQPSEICLWATFLIKAISIWEEFKYDGLRKHTFSKKYSWEAKNIKEVRHKRIIVFSDLPQRSPSFFIRSRAIRNDPLSSVLTHWSTIALSKTVGTKS